MDISRRYNDRVARSFFRGEIAGRFDVIVAGLGTAGAIAAIAAARKGLRVLAVERLHAMGGVGTAGAVWNYYFGSRGGLYETLDNQTQEMIGRDFARSNGVNGEAKLMAMEQEAIKLGVTIKYESTITGVLMREQQVCGIEWISADGRFAAESKVVIDCTGDAEACAAAGFAFRRGRLMDGQAQPFSNVWLRLDQGRVSFRHTDSGYVNQGDAQDMSRAILESATNSTHLRSTYEEHDRMLRIAPLLGLREGRLIEGEENATLENFLNGHYTTQPLFFAYANVDIHGKDIAFENEMLQKWLVVCNMWGHKLSVPIPIGALIPKGADGLLVAGRCLAVDHDMAACVRMKRDMQKLGEAAAYVAYLSIVRRVALREVPYTELSALLAETGCLPKEEVDAQWLAESVSIRPGLSGSSPGLAIWSAVRIGDSFRGQLKEWMVRHQDEHLGRHSAFALALLGDASSAPLLRKIASEKDPFVPLKSQNHKSNHPRGYAAIFLLGLLADKEAASMLYRLLEAKPEDFPNPDEDNELSVNRQELIFQYISCSVMALARIGDRHPDSRSDTAAAYRKLLRREDLDLVLTLPGAPHIPYEMNTKIRQAAEQALQQWGIALQ